MLSAYFLLQQVEGKTKDGALSKINNSNNNNNNIKNQQQQQQKGKYLYNNGGGETHLSKFNSSYKISLSSDCPAFIYCK